MGRAPCCDKANVKRGPWSPEEDAALKSYLERHGTGGNWIALPQKAGLRRCGKSCRLRWLNYLRPDIKHGGFTDEEDNIICSLYKSMGSRWSVIASHLQGRTDNDVKNYWNTKLKKKLLAAKTQFTTSNFPTSINITNHSHQLVTSSSSPALVPKFEYHDYNNNHGFSNYLTNQMQFPTSSRDPIHHFQLPNQLPEASVDFGLTSINNQHHSAASSTQETTSSHSSLTMENGTISWWPNNGTDDYDRLLMEFGFGVTYDIGFGVQDQRTTEASPSLAAANSNFY